MFRPHGKGNRSALKPGRGDCPRAHGLPRSEKGTRSIDASSRQAKGFVVVALQDSNLRPFPTLVDVPYSFHGRIPITRQYATPMNSATTVTPKNADANLIRSSSV